MKGYCMSNIILIGFMGCGKTSVGKKLAQYYNLDFMDTDLLIEENNKMSIKDIFSEKGEEYFRELETNTIKSLLNNMDNTVISVGGGLPIKTGNGDILRSLGIVVYLDASFDTIKRRLKNDSARPLFSNSENKKEALYYYRKPIYESCAHITIQVDNKSLDEITQELYSNISKYMNNLGKV